MKLLVVLLVFVSAAFADGYEKIAYEFTENQPEVRYFINKYFL